MNNICIDQDALNEMRNAMGSKFTVLLQLYLKDTRARLEEMDRLMKSPKDIENLVVNAHSIHSSSAHMGAAKLSNLAALMELKVSENKPVDLSVILEEMKQAFVESEAALQDLYKEELTN